MYSYIYDSFLSDKKYEKKLIQLENRVTDLGINGHIHRLSILKSASEIIKDEVAAGSNTIVVVGNDKTVNHVIDAIANKQVTLGIIPIGPDNNIASAIGITDNNAIESLSKRIIQKIDLGKVNDVYFLSSLRIINTNAQIEHNGFTISPRFDLYNIDIYNFILNKKEPVGILPPNALNPTDGILDAIVYNPGKASIMDRIFRKKQTEINTFLPFKKIKIKKPSTSITEDDKEEIKIIIDGEKITKTPAVVEIAENCLKIIVGKDRNF